MKSKEENYGSIFFIISILILLYLIFIIIPYSRNNCFSSEGIDPTNKETLIFFSIIVPAFIGYIISIFKYLRKAINGNALNYPFAWINILSLSYFTQVARVGGFMVWFLIFIIPIAVIGFIFLFIAGIIKDNKYKEGAKIE